MELVPELMFSALAAIPAAILEMYFHVLILELGAELAVVEQNGPTAFSQSQ